MTSTESKPHLIDSEQARAWAEHRRSPHFSGLTLFFQKIWFVFAGLAVFLAIDSGPDVAIPLIVLMLCAFFTYLQFGVSVSAIGLIFVFPVILLADFLRLSHPRWGEPTAIRGVRYDSRKHMLVYRESAGKNVSIGVENVFELTLDPANSRPIIHVYREGNLFPAHVSNKRCTQRQVDQMKADLEGWRESAMREWFAKFGSQTKAFFDLY